MLKSLSRSSHSILPFFKSKRGKLFLFLALLKILVFYFVFLSPSKKDDEQFQHFESAVNNIAAKATAVVDPPPPLVPDPTPPKFLSTLMTTQGNIGIQFLPDAAPYTVENFIQLAKMGFFNGTTMYRYEPNFVLQGGAWPKKHSPLPPVPLEYNLPNQKYFISTARTSDPNSATCEFSIMLNDNGKWLGPGGSDKYGYAVFAKVVSGFDVIDKFSQLKTKNGSGLNLLDPAVDITSWVVHS